MQLQRNDKLCWQREVGEPYTLDDRTEVMGTGPSGPIKLAFMGDHPSVSDCKLHEPFSDQVGAHLHGHLSAAGIYSSGCYFTNVIDRTPDKQMKSAAAREAMELQNASAWEELTWLKSRGLRVVVALGEDAAAFFGIKEPLSKCRGSIYEVNIGWKGIVTDPAAEPCDFVVIPTYHPAKMRSGSRFERKNEEIRADLTSTWIVDFQSAKRIIDFGYTRPVERFITSPTMDQVVQYCQARIEAAQPVAIDIETSGFNPKADNVVCIGLAHTTEDAICIPFYHTGPTVTPRTRYWTPSESEMVKLWIERLFATCPLIGQNAVFDVGYLQQAGWHISADNIAHDTMIAHHAVDSEMKHNLGFITSIYGHTPYWKGEFLTRDTTIWQMNFEDLQVYNLRDCIVLHQVLAPILADIEEIGTQETYASMLRLIGPIIEMQQTGALISRGRWNKWKKRFAEDIARLQAELLKLGKLPADFGFKPAETLLFLYNIKAPKHIAAVEYDKHKLGSAVRQSKQQLHELVQKIHPLWLHNYKGISSGKTDTPSLDKQGIAGLRIHASNRLEELQDMKRRTSDHDLEEEQLRAFTKWLDKYAELSRVEKAESMFRELPIRDDGRMHPSFLVTGTATGRLACIKPNIQQWNKEEGADEAVREIIVAPNDHYIVAADYDSLEFRIMAYECGDPKMLSIIEQGLNQHDENTRALFRIEPDHPKWSIYRHAAKTYQFASQYGAGDRKLHQTLTIQVPEANFTMTDIKTMRQNFSLTYRTWAAWCKRVQSDATTTRTIRNAFGRVRRLFGQDYQIRTQALNTPIQSAAADIMNDALYRVWKRIHSEKLRTRVQAQIHDELRFEVPKDELSYICMMVREEMSKPVDFRGKHVVFPVSVSFGPDWHNLRACEDV